MPAIKEMAQETLQTRFFARNQGHRRVPLRIGMTDIICCILWVLAIVEIIWAAGQVGDLIVVAMRAAGTGWV